MDSLVNLFLILVIRLLCVVGGLGGYEYLAADKVSGVLKGAV